MITETNKFVPFIPLSKDSDCGFNALFYCSNKKIGDIVIDCSYTKNTFKQIEIENSKKEQENENLKNKIN